jgi:hypothetical protein
MPKPPKKFTLEDLEEFMHADLLDNFDDLFAGASRELPGYPNLEEISPYYLEQAVEIPF